MIPRDETGASKPGGGASKETRGDALFEPIPWAEAVEGCWLLDELTAAFKRHLALPEGAAEAMALWVLFAHTHNAHSASPRLALISPVPECGKTTALAILSHLVTRPVAVSNITPAVIFRMIEARRPTLLIDEADTFLHSSEDIKGILNSGHTRATANVVRCVGDNYEPKKFSTWTPIAIAKIGKLPATLESRSIEIAMRRRRPDENVTRLTVTDCKPLQVLAQKAARWAADCASALAAATPEIPHGLYNRTRDNWEPLLAIADAAGGHWPETARRIAVQVSGGAEDPTRGVQLLSDIRAIFEAKKADRLKSDDLCRELGKLEDRPWVEIDQGRPIKPRGLARLLKPFGISPQSIRVGDQTPKGYTRAAFEDAFARYLPDPGSATATPQQWPEPEGLGKDQAQHEPQHGDAAAQHASVVADDDCGVHRRNWTVLRCCTSPSRG